MGSKYVIKINGYKNIIDVFKLKIQEEHERKRWNKKWIIWQTANQRSRSVNEKKWSVQLEFDGPPGAYNRRSFKRNKHIISGKECTF
jgi:hypothetical protein